MANAVPSAECQWNISKILNTCYCVPWQWIRHTLVISIFSQLKLCRKPVWKYTCQLWASEMQISRDACFWLGCVHCWLLFPELRASFILEIWRLVFETSIEEFWMWISSWDNTGQLTGRQNPRTTLLTPTVIPPAIQLSFLECHYRQAMLTSDTNNICWLYAHNDRSVLELSCHNLCKVNTLCCTKKSSPFICFIHY